jgi:hypothetical protein
MLRLCIPCAQTIRKAIDGLFDVTAERKVELKRLLGLNAISTTKRRCSFCKFREDADLVGLDGMGFPKR